MHALLRLSLLASSLYLCWQLVRWALRGDSQQLHKVTSRLRLFATLNGALLVAWIVLLARK